MSHKKARNASDIFIKQCCNLQTSQLGLRVKIGIEISTFYFLPRCMECRRGLSDEISVRLSVRLSVCQTRAL